MKFLLSKPKRISRIFTITLTYLQEILTNLLDFQISEKQYLISSYQYIDFFFSKYHSGVYVIYHTVPFEVFPKLLPDLLHISSVLNINLTYLLGILTYLQERY